VKSYSISKEVVYAAYGQVRANKGSPGVDIQTIAEFEKKRDKNLYKLWNRMSSGSYLPPPVRTVFIPKRDGKKRQLGIPTVTDRIAQTIAKIYLEPLVEKSFHQDSYGYRPTKSALEAVGAARERCWQHAWVIDLDIKGFFDNIDHDIMLSLVEKHTDCKWVLLYLKRWLKAPAQLADGTLVERNKGTPQGGVISPLLANIFLHFAFDTWMKETFSTVPFERYADDIIVHCKTEKQASFVKDSIEGRLRQYKLELHPEKTKIIYCRNSKRQGEYPHQKFDFLGFTFRARGAKDKSGEMFQAFTPAVSNRAKKDMSHEIRSWHIDRSSDRDLQSIARIVNPSARGWINYFGRFHKSALTSVFVQINNALVRWATRKYKRFYRKMPEAEKWLVNIANKNPTLFVHWHLLGIKHGSWIMGAV
jgi:RNA-directed DNA polymerase